MRNGIACNMAHFAVALTLLLAFLPAISQATEAGTCSSSGEETCSGVFLGYCSSTPGCSLGAGNCNTKEPRTDLCTNYGGVPRSRGYMCMGDAGVPDYCANEISYDACITHKCTFSGWPPEASCNGCEWTGGCLGTPNCTRISGNSLCISAHCTWTPPEEGCIESGEETRCWSNPECCSGICYGAIEKRCIACMPENGVTCTVEGQKAECCSGLTCQQGQCLPPPQCKSEGVACTRESDCCKKPTSEADFHCDLLNDPSSPLCRQCADAGERCGGSLGCCNGQCGQDGTCPIPKMKTCMLSDALPIAALAALGALVLVALAYMGGELMQNARLLTWAKTEAMQLLVSVAIAGLVIFAANSFCTAGIGEVSSMLGVPSPLIYKGYAGTDYYSGSLLYLENLAAASLANVAQLRYNLGAYEIRTTYTEYTCDGFCLLSLSSINVARFGGETVNLAVTNTMLGTATVAYLSVVFQYFTLQYILNGVFALFLPLAIIIRSLPFMRHFGGALIGIIISLYLFYPLMIVADAHLAPSLAKGLSSQAMLYERSGTTCERAGVNVFGEYNAKSGQQTNYLNCTSTETQSAGLLLLNMPITAHIRTEAGLDNTGSSETEMNHLDDPSGSVNEGLANSIEVNALIFLSAIFLPAINFIVIAALARDLTHFLGEEADISRLGQMV